MPEGGLEVRAMEGSPSVAEMFTHIHYVRLVFVSEDAPEFARRGAERRSGSPSVTRLALLRCWMRAPRRCGTR